MKIIRFEQDAEQYYNTAVKLSEAGDFFGCLKNLRDAERLLENESNFDYESMQAVKAEIAATLSDMGLYNESIKEYYKIYTETDDLAEEVFFGLVRNYALLDMIPQSAYYLNKGMDLMILDPGEGFEHLDLAEEYNGLKLFKNFDNEYMLGVAKQLMGTAESGFAVQILEAIPSDSEKYSEARVFLSLLELKKQNWQESIDYAEQALSADKNNLNALTMKILALDKGGKIDERDSLVNLLVQHENLNWTDCGKIALCMSKINDSKLTLKYAKEFRKNAPYDKVVGLLYAQANANLGYIDEAKAELLKLQTIFPRDITIKFYARKIFDIQENTSIVLQADIPAEIQEGIFSDIDNFLMSAKTIKSAVKGIKNDADLREKLEYLFQSENLPQMAHVGSFLAQSGEWNGFFQDFFVDPDAQAIVKKECLLMFLQFAPDKSFNIVINHIMRSLDPKLPVNCNLDLETAYWEVFCTLTFMEEDFTKKLNRAFKKIVKIFDDTEKIDIPAMSTLIAYKSKSSRLFSEKKNCIEIFNCNEKHFNNYLNIFSQSVSTK